MFRNAKIIILECLKYPNKPHECNNKNETTGLPVYSNYSELQDKIILNYLSQDLFSLTLKSFSLCF